MSGSAVAPVAPVGGGRISIWLRGQKYAPIVTAATTVTTAERLAATASSVRRTCGWGCEAIGCVEGSVPVEARKGCGAGRDDRVETLARGDRTGERDPLHARERHRHRGGAASPLDSRRRG